MSCLLPIYILRKVDLNIILKNKKKKSNFLQQNRRAESHFAENVSHYNRKLSTFFL